MLHNTLLSDLQIMRHMMERLTSDFDRGLIGLHGWNRYGETKDWTFTLPVANYRSETALNLRVVMPGIGNDDFELLTTENRLIIRGERKVPEGFERDENAHFVLPYGRFENVIELPTGFKLEGVEARFYNGILDLKIPVAEPVKPKRLKITTSGVTEKVKELVSKS